MFQDRLAAEGTFAEDRLRRRRVAEGNELADTLLLGAAQPQAAATPATSR